MDERKATAASTADEGVDLDRFWQGLLQGSHVAGRVSSLPTHFSSIDANAPTPNPVGGSTHGGAARTESSEAASELDNFEILRRLYQHRELLAGELARETPVPQHTRIAFGSPEPVRLQPRTLGDYQLLEQIGRGGMGVVYKARQMSLGRIVALKHMRAGKFAYEDEIERFRVEVETAARLQHPNIVAIHEVGVEHGEPYFSMEYVEGPSLSEMVREQLLQPAQAALYVSAIAIAVDYAHGRGVIHRDLKPSNILIGPEDQPKITDFGLAKQFAIESDTEEAAPRPALTHTGDIIGTPSYMSPEQASGIQNKIGPAADIYALGAVLYELVTGKPPFRAETSLGTLKLVLEVEPVAPRLLNPQIPRDLENICLKCLAKEPEKRYATAQKLAEDLQRFLQGTPVLARPVGPAERLWRFCRRHPQIAGLTAIAAGLLIVTAVVASAAAYREAGLRQTADVQAGIAKGERVKAVQAQKDEASARLNAEQSRNQAQLELADNLLRRGVMWCEQGEPVRGILAFAECLKALPAGRKDLSRADHVEQAARLNLSIWLGRIHQLQRSLLHPGGINAFAASADGSLLITGGQDGSIIIWDAATGKRRGDALQHGAPLRAVALSPDGKYAATAGTDELVRLWRTETGTLVREPVTEDDRRRRENKFLGEAMLAQLAAQDQENLQQASSFYNQHPPRLEFTADGNRLVTNCGRYPLLNVTTGEPVGLPRTPHERCQAIAVSRSGEQMIAAYSVAVEAELRLIKTANGAAVPEFQPRIRSLWSLAFSADERQLIVGIHAGLTYYDLATGMPIGEPHKVDIPTANVGLGNLAEERRQNRDERLVLRRWNTVPGTPKTLDVHPLVPLLFLGTADAAVVWNLKTNTVAGRALRHQSDVFLARLSSQDQWALTAGHDYTVRIWDLSTNSLSGQALHQTNPVVGAAMVNGDRSVAVATRSGALQLWNLARRPGAQAPTLTHQVYLQRILAAGNFAATNGSDGTLRLWDVTAANLVRELPKVVHSNRVEDTLCAFDRSGQIFATRTEPTTVQLFDARTGAAREPAIKAPREVLDLALSRTGRLLAATLSSQEPGSTLQTQTFEVLLWDTMTGERLGEPIPTCANQLVFSPDEKWLATASTLTPKSIGKRSTDGNRREILAEPDQQHRSQGQVHLWSTLTGKPIGEPLPITTSAWRLAISTDSRLLAVAGFDQSIYVWDVGAQKMLTQLTHQGGAKWLLFSDRGQRLISGGSDGNVRIWNLNEPVPTGHELTHYAEIVSLSLSPDESIVAVGCFDNSYRLWHVATGEPIGPTQRGGPLVAFAGSGRLLAQASNGAALFPVAEPILETPTEVRARCQALTGHEVDATGRLRAK